MKKAMLLILLVLSLTVNSACSDRSLRTLPASELNYKTDLDMNSPEGLAKASSEVYRLLADEKVTVTEAIDKLAGYSKKESAAELRNRAEEFKKQINDFVSYLKDQDDRIEGYEFAKTVYVNDQEAYIERIQKHKNGKCYYFKQDYIIEDGQWKISGDNITDRFTLKGKSLFSLFGK